MCGVYNTFPFTKLPDRLIIELCYASVFCLNFFHPCRNPINDMNHCTLLTGQEVDYHRHCRFKFGEYAQAHKSTDTSINSCTVGSLEPCPSDHKQGGFFFLSLLTGHWLHWHLVTCCPMPQESVKCVLQFDTCNPDGLLFRYCNNRKNP